MVLWGPSYSFVRPFITSRGPTLLLFFPCYLCGKSLKHTGFSLQKPSVIQAPKAVRFFLFQGSKPLVDVLWEKPEIFLLPSLKPTYPLKVDGWKVGRIRSFRVSAHRFRCELLVSGRVYKKNIRTANKHGEKDVSKLVVCCVSF